MSLATVFACPYRCRFVLLIAALFLSGCSGMMQSVKESITKEEIDYKPRYTVKLDARSDAAEITKKKASVLEREDYVDLGKLSVKYVNKTCFPGEKCSTETHSDLPTNRLRTEARSQGADLVKLGANNSSSSGQAVKNGRCLSTKQVSDPYSVCDHETVCDRWGCSTRQTFCRTEYRTRTVCDKYEKIYGTEYFTRSSASIWRQDKGLKAQVIFGDKFYQAAIKGQMAKVKSYSKQGIRVDIPDLRGRNPLMFAVNANQVAIAEFFLEGGANPKIDNSRTLVTASEKNNTQMVKLLLKHGAEPDAEIGFFKVLTTSLSSKKGSKAAQMEKGKPLIGATKRGNMEMTKALLEANADPDVEDGLPLKQAISSNNREMIKLLLAHNASTNEDGVLTQTVMKNDVELLKVFLKRGANPNSKTWSGKTPLQEAAARGQVKMMDLLINEGAGINKRGVGGENTPLMLAASAGQVEAVKRLIAAKADLDVVNVPTGLGLFSSMLGMKGKTALTLARSKLTHAKGQRKNDYLEIIDALVEAGAK